MPKRTLNFTWRLFRGAAFEWFEDKVPRMAAAIAFYTVFSLTPIILISLAVGSVFFAHEDVLNEILEQTEFLIGPQGTDAIRLLVEHAPPREDRGLATLAGLAALFIGATASFTELKDSLNTIWEVQPKPGLGILEMIRDRILSFAMMLVIGFLLLVSLIISTILAAGRKHFAEAMPFVWLEAAHLVGSWVVITLLFAMIYRFLPDVKVRWNDVWVGASITSILFALGKTLFGIYLGHSTIGSAYGAAGSLVIVLLWTYYSALILLFGAEITQVQAKLTRVRIEPGEKAVKLTEHERIQQGMPHEPPQ
jgi:membrane protein